MSEVVNPQIELAFDYIQNTNKNIFLTGKAGTGKTTFLHRVRKEVVKRMVVVAPTGIAAINAKGMTMHSFFQLPFGAFLPGETQNVQKRRHFRQDKLNLIRSLDLLIIDEISMVRSDVLDSVDEVLRGVRQNDAPFGGIQLLMIGDLHQLPPVAKREEWAMLQKYYQTPYFFGSLALQKTDTLTIELTHIYRQSDAFFIGLLNKVRNNRLDEEVLQAINSRYIPNFEPKKEEGYITLTSHNKTAYQINSSRLAAIDKTLYQFTATITGNFPKHSYPTDEVLEFKVGAQIVFIKNDASYEKRYYNGKIGQITAINDDEIEVKCPGEHTAITVSMVEWENTEYNLDEQTKEVKEEVVGVFKQFPMKLAWAITIHKSQGLTFDKAIIDAKAAFAHGQVYVALSRCRSFEGIVLLSEIGFSSVKTDHVVKNYSEEASKNPPTTDHLRDAKRDYQQALIRELFNFKLVAGSSKMLHRVFLEHDTKFVTPPLSAFLAFSTQLEEEVVKVAKKFEPSLAFYFRADEIPSEHEELKERLKAASAYFMKKIGNELLPALRKIPVSTDNQAVSELLENRMEQLEKGLFVKKACFSASVNGFSTHKYIKAKANADLDYVEYQRAAAVKARMSEVPTNSPHPKLHAQLLQWRLEESEAQGVRPYEILPSKGIAQIVAELPVDKSGLLRVKGIGQVKARQYGKAIIRIVETYCTENKIPLDAALMFDDFTPPPKKKKIDTKQISLDAFNEGKTVEAIAKERGLVQSTIEGHLAYWIEAGELDIFKVLERSVVDEIVAHCKSNQDSPLGDIKKHFEDRYSYGALKMVLAAMKRGDV